MAILLMVTYKLSGRSPVDRRVEFFKSYYSDCDIDVVSLFEIFGRKRGVFNRLQRLILGRKRFLNTRDLDTIEGYATRKDYTKVIISVPDAEILEFFLRRKIVLNNVHLDIRDGIYFENLYSRPEKLFLGKYLKKLEDMVPSFTEISTNTPSLKRYYEKAFSVHCELLLPEYKNRLKLPKNLHKVLFIGGLMRSSIGLNAINFSIALRSTPDVSATFVGRFYSMEKLLYSMLSNGRIHFKDEMNIDELREYSRSFDCALVFANCKREVMPSKISVYSEFNLPFIWIGNEDINNLFLSEQLYFTRTDDNSKSIRSALLNV